MWERKINALEQRLLDIDGTIIHVVLKRGSAPEPLPVLITDGWACSFLELLEVADRLAQPERSGERPEEAFTVVMPSFPGYGFSPRPARPMSPDRAEVWSCIMSTLGFDS